MKDELRPREHSTHTGAAQGNTDVSRAFSVGVCGTPSPHAFIPGVSCGDCRKTQGLIRGRSPLWLYSDLATCAANPQKALAQQGFPCIRCWPRHRRKHRMKKLKKVAYSHFFDTLSPDVVWAFRFQSAFAARMAYRRYLKLKILEIALRTPFAAQVGLL